MRAVELMLENEMSLRKALAYSGCSRKMYYYEPVQGGGLASLDPSIVSATERIALERPSYGTRRMAAMLSRELHVPVNRKRVQRIYRALNWIQPSLKKKDIIRAASSNLVDPRAPYELWEADFTYVWCGLDRWCYLFSVLDVFSREWTGYAFDTRARSDNAIASVNNALATHTRFDVSKLTLRVDNGSQYTSRRFTESMKALGVRVEHIYASTPEQNGSVESFHGRLKREYVWPREFRDYQEAEIAMADACTDYNARRIHSSLDYKTPNEFITEWRTTHRQ
jgi:putative transposase